MVDSTGVRSPSFWLRVVQLIFGIIAFAPIAEASGYSRVDYAIFCGVVTMLGSLVLIGCHLAGISAAHGLPSLVYDALFWIFWLSCAAALSDSLNTAKSYGAFAGDTSRLEASVAFSWLTWFSFFGSLALDVLHMRNHSAASAASTDAGVAMPGDAKAGAPAGATSVSVVSSV